MPEFQELKITVSLQDNLSAVLAEIKKHIAEMQHVKGHDKLGEEARKTGEQVKSLTHHTGLLGFALGYATNVIWGALDEFKKKAVDLVANTSKLRSWAEGMSDFAQLARRLGVHQGEFKAVHDQLILQGFTSPQAKEFMAQMASITDKIKYSPQFNEIRTKMLSFAGTNVELFNKLKDLLDEYEIADTYEKKANVIIRSVQAVRDNLLKQPGMAPETAARAARVFAEQAWGVGPEVVGMSRLLVEHSREYLDNMGRMVVEAEKYMKVMHNLEYQTQRISDVFMRLKLAIFVIPEEWNAKAYEKTADLLEWLTLELSPEERKKLEERFGEKLRERTQQQRPQRPPGAPRGGMPWRFMGLADENKKLIELHDQVKESADYFQIITNDPRRRALGLLSTQMGGLGAGLGGGDGFGGGGGGGGGRTGTGAGAGYGGGGPPTPHSGAAPGSREQASSGGASGGGTPYYYGGKVTIGDKEFNYGTGGGGRGALPYGTYSVNIGTGDIGPLGRSRLGSVATIGGLGGVVNDPRYPGAPRQGIQIHASSSQDLDRLYTAGCFAVPKSQWPAFKQALLEESKKGPLSINLDRSGSARIGPTSSITAANQKGHNAPQGGAEGESDPMVLPWNSSHPGGGASWEARQTPRYYRGKVTIGGKEFDYGTGNIGRGAVPWGTYPINIGANDIGRKGRKLGSVATLGGLNGIINDPRYPGAPRTGVQIHASSSATLDRLYSEGCFAVARAQWPDFKAALLEEAKKGPLSINLDPSGRAIIGETSEVTAQASRSGGFDEGGTTGLELSRAGPRGISARASEIASERQQMAATRFMASEGGSGTYTPSPEQQQRMQKISDVLPRSANVIDLRPYSNVTNPFLRKGLMARGGWSTEERLRADFERRMAKEHEEMAEEMRRELDRDMGTEIDGGEVEAGGNVDVEIPPGVGAPASQNLFSPVPLNRQTMMDQTPRGRPSQIPEAE
jgi:hypothetical protein